MTTPQIINLPPPSDPVTPSDVPSRSGTPNSTTTSMSELSTVAIKDGHRGHLPHHHPSGLANQIDAERADRISRLAGLERVATARNPTPTNLTPGATAPPQGHSVVGYFDGQGNPHLGKERSTVGSASATGSVGGRTTWADSEADRMSESQDMEMENSSVGGMSEEGGASLVAFGEGARTPARQSVVSATGAKGSISATTPTARDAKMIDGMTYDRDVVDTTASETARRDARLAAGGGPGAETAERIMRENMNISSSDRMRGGSAQGADLGKFGFEK